MRRRLNSNEGLELLGRSDNALEVAFQIHAQRIYFNPRAREIRWLHDQLETELVALRSLTTTELAELLERVTESFNGRAED